MKLKSAVAAVAVATLPFGASAAVVNQLDIIGDVNPSNSEYLSTGHVDFVGTGKATVAAGIFSPVVTLDEALAGPVFSPTLFALSDFDFATAGVIYQGAGFTFEATSFDEFDNTFPGRGFSAIGTISGAFGSLPALFSLSSQATTPDQVRVSFSSTSSVSAIPLPASALMLLTALGGLGGLGFLSLRRKSVIA